MDLAETARAAREELARIRAGDWGDPRSHLHHEHHPIPAEETRYGILVEVWSAISVSLLLIATIALIYLGILSVWVAILVVIAAYAFVEAAFQRRLTTLLLRLTLLLAVDRRDRPGGHLRRPRRSWSLLDRPRRDHPPRQRPGAARPLTWVPRSLTGRRRVRSRSQRTPPREHPVICPACGTANAAGRRFCLECGGPLAVACPSLRRLERGRGQVLRELRQPDRRGRPAGASRRTGRPAPRRPGGRRGEDPAAAGGATAERRLVSVLFADLVGFTALAADRDPEATRELLGRYFEPPATSSPATAATWRSSSATR